ncbi:MAG: hypothetical protein MRZ79_23960 [Bacteroidia bacterium]|nr:hypothetical protein [Bacteroidia bacterium]
MTNFALAVIAASLSLLYFLSWFFYSAIALSNEKPDWTMKLGNFLEIFVRKILAFPFNLINKEYPFLLDRPAASLNSRIFNISLVLLNFILQVAMIYLPVHFILRFL